MGYTFNYEESSLKLIDLQLHEEPLNPHMKFTLTARYHQTEKNGCQKEIIIPRIALPFNTNFIVAGHNSITDAHTANFGFGETELLPNYKGDVIITKILKGPDPKELTIDEIEAKLGYPIKIVKEKK